ncbi:MAG: hypothetical protein LBD03_06665 [Methanobrevibacter sp.]|jgi:hypothetical protein|nr:hypothetical protein [Candidatus Methanovirga procula]
MKNQVNSVEKIKVYLIEELHHIQISDVFVIPKRVLSTKKGFDFENYYQQKITSKQKVYYLRSFGANFCIVPYALFKREKAVGVFSIGKGLYGESEKDIILIESFSYNPDHIHKMRKKYENILKKVNDILDYEYKSFRRGDLFWSTVSISMN